MEILGYFMAILVGFSLGLVGGGGSILAVPVLAYLFGLDEKMATAYSLFVVGCAALIGALRQHQYGNVDRRTTIVFGFPALLGVWIVRHFLVPALPDVLFSIAGFELSRRMGMFGMFSLLMIWAAYYMLSSKERKSGTGDFAYNYPVIVVEGLFVGGLTGFVGAGGGFLIIPALILFANIDVKRAIGTSLMIIAFKSLLGFLLGDALTSVIDWSFLLAFTGLAILGIFVGIGVGKFIEGTKLKRIFGFFVIAMACFILTMEFIIQPLSN
ncbi:MAG: hypothetical protein CL834_04785 [Crocinitomicaceae bacterium]|nr:hypothetical protein [Crocinitomicaceae bacterium]|tara:strand:- start:1567 stop:2373 length:807 start_codon:yes stop_codon:yes gene_type:complete